MYVLLLLGGLLFVIACCKPSHRFVKSRPRRKFEVKILSCKLLTRQARPEVPWPVYQSVEDQPSFIDG